MNRNRKLILEKREGGSEKEHVLFRQKQINVGTDATTTQSLLLGPS